MYFTVRHKQPLNIYSEYFLFTQADKKYFQKSEWAGSGQVTMLTQSPTHADIIRKLACCCPYCETASPIQSESERDYLINECVVTHGSTQTDAYRLV